MAYRSTNPYTNTVEKSFDDLTWPNSDASEPAIVALMVLKRNER